MSDCRYDRRTLLKDALVGLAALPASELIHEAAAQGALPHVDEKEAQAVSLGYVDDVKKVDPSNTPQFKPGSHCANCLQLTGKEGDEWRPCNIFPGKLVNANGWCKVWAPKPA
jgi:High potential iron-sulfur protein